MEIEVTIDELLQAFVEAKSPSEGDGFTREEIQKAKGWSKDKTLAALRVLADAGRLHVGTKHVTYIDGRTNWKVCYSILPKPKTKRNK